MPSSLEKLWAYAVLVCLLSIPSFADEPGKLTGPTSDRVGFPAKYSADFHLIRTFYIEKRIKVATVYENTSASSATDLAKLPYPDGSTIVFEWADPQRDAKGELVRGADGNVLKGEITRVDVMRHESNFGESYGADRAGNWEFASYQRDGSLLMQPKDSVSCAKCHQKAGADRDFVYRGHFGEKTTAQSESQRRARRLELFLASTKF